MNRVVALVDMDCFYVQVEQKLQPQYKGKPCAVAQYKKWKGGGLIAVGYEARAFGVTRQMMGDDARKKCPDLHLFRVPELRGKADLTKYREAGAEVITVLSTFSQCVERASVDEAYIDLTEEVDRLLQHTDMINATDLPNTYVVGNDSDGVREKAVEDWLTSVYDGQEFSEANRRLAAGAKIAEDMRAEVYRVTGYRCSAGIGHNKMLAKLVCGFHKPNKQTVIPQDSVSGLFSTLPLTKIRHLGGKLGQSVMEQLQVENIGDLCRFTVKELQQYYGDKTGYWLYEVCRGTEREPVSARQLPKSIGCSKNFRGKEALDTRDKVRFWLAELSGEIVERLDKDKEMNKRVGRSLTVSIRYRSNPSSVSATRVCALTRYDRKKIEEDALALLQKFNTSAPHQAVWIPAIICLGLSAGKFQDESNGGAITAFLGNKNRETLPLPASQGQKESIASFFKSSVESSESDCLDNGKDSTLDTSFGDLSSQRKPSALGLLNKDTVSPPHKQINLVGIQSFFTKACSDGNNVQTSPVSQAGDQNHISKRVETNAGTGVVDKSEKKGFFAMRNCGKSESNIVPNTTCSESSNSVLMNTCTPNRQKESWSESVVEEYLKPRLPLNILESTLQTFTPKIQSTMTSLSPNSHSSNSTEISISDLAPDVKSDDDYVPCEKCQKRILVWDLPEHMDFHFAQDLQKSMAYKTPLLAKRKHQSTSPTKNKKLKTKQTNSKTIDSFFGKH
ncbi:DNA polymerase eta-like [Ylistrum balloti]|uniref:DNA polymerase eta-like n=1 Tax=Ylistrum balloti TaxID=509963 RepID=UPI002905E3DF|nr:DNA polymerase eta-like [Ylistrum balloti]